MVDRGEREKYESGDCARTRSGSAMVLVITGMHVVFEANSTLIYFNIINVLDWFITSRSEHDAENTTERETHT